MPEPIKIEDLHTTRDTLIQLENIIPAEAYAIVISKVTTVIRIAEKLGEES